MRVQVSAALLFVIMAVAAPAEAQRVRAPQDSSSARCLDVSWLSPDAVCEGRVLNSMSGALVGASAGALAGYAGGAIIPTRCIGNHESAAVRGAIAGAIGGTGLVLVTRHVSRRAVAEREARLTARARTDTTRGFWRELQPVLRVVGVMAVGGAAIGASQGLRKPSPCSGGVAGGAGTGAAVYGGGTATTIAGSLLVVRFLF